MEHSPTPRRRSYGANKPDIAIYNKKERQWLIFEGTVCSIGQIQERDKLKTEKYAEFNNNNKAAA